MRKKSFDIIIVGGGMVGATLALALAQRTSLSIGLFEAQSQLEPWHVETNHHRVSAIALASQKIFKALNVWDAMQAMRVSPFTAISVSEANNNAAIHFDANEVAEALLGFIIENNVIQAALVEKLKQYANVDFIHSLNLTKCEVFDSSIVIKTDDGQEFSAKLAVAADGANSWLRQQVEISVNQADYLQRAIVATVRTELPHEKTARQVFLPTGPLAFLPLKEANTSSIVWSLPTSEAERLFTLEKTEFMRELASAFSEQLGNIIAVEERHVFPLYKQQAAQYVKSRVVLVGDAAHTVHPLAGQGVNIGLLDAASLVDVIIEALAKQRDFSALATLRRYERWRRADNLAMIAGIDLIKQLFANEKKSIQQLRSLGLAATNKFPWLKNKFIRHAVGMRGDLPTLAL